MGKKLIEITTKVPDWATPAVLMAMRQEGKTLEQIGQLIGVTGERVRQILKQAQQATLARAQQMAQENENANDSLH